MAGVSFRDVRKKYGELEVIHGVTTEVADGEFVVIVGPSGCGKSTLLRMVAGLETITSGEIAIGGRVVNRLEPKDRDIAMVFQNYALYPHMSVRENMAYGLRIRRMASADIEARVQRAAEILELGPFLDRKPRALSGGQRQRVAMGRAIVREPAVFLFDEPLSNLDAKLRVAMRTELKELHQRLETTSIYVTHDQIEAMTMADQIVVMRDGVVEQRGQPLDLYDHPANLFVAGFIGSPPMNFVRNVTVAGNSLIENASGTPHALPVSSLQRFDGSIGGRELVLGVRPQDVAVTPVSSGGDLRGKVELIQLVGSEKLLDLALPSGARITAEVRAELPVAMGQEVGVRFDPERVHLFDAGTEGNVLPTAALRV